MSETEKRRWERYVLDFPVSVSWKGASGTVEERRGRTKDISSYGVCVKCSDPMEEGLKVDVKIDLPIALEGMMGSRMSAEGTVVRNGNMAEPGEGYEYGIVFDRSYP
jgi:hypothetical protein